MDQETNGSIQDLTKAGRGHGRSRELFKKAEGRIPGGVNSPARAFRAVGGDPIFIDRGQGALMYDADGNFYLDYVGSWGPLILGHRHTSVTKALYQVIMTDDPSDARRLNPAIPKELRVVLDAALEKNRDRRYQTAEAFADDLRRVRKFERGEPPDRDRPGGR